MADGRAKNGGKRPNSGRKSNIDADELQRVLSIAVPEPERIQAFEVLSGKARSGDVAALTLLLGYLYGKPVQRQEVTGANGGPFVVTGYDIFTPAGVGGVDDGRTD